MNEFTYNAYRELCIDRGVFPIGQAQCEHMTGDQWLNYMINVLRELPSRAERMATGEIVPERF